MDLKESSSPPLSRYDKLVGAYHKKSIRERLLICLAILAVVYLGLQNTVGKIITAEKDSLVQQADVLQKEQLSIQGQLLIFSESAITNSNAAYKEQLVYLETKTTSLEAELKLINEGLLGSRQLLKVIESIAVNAKKVKLEQLYLFPKKEPEKASDGSKTLTTAETLGYEKHKVRLQLTGKYFELRDFLKKLEDSPWPLYWQSLDYQVLNYPQARMWLQVYTVSNVEAEL